VFCPKCGVRNVDDAKFCRACGADISLVPQALTRTLPEGAFGVLEVAEEEKKGKKHRKYKFKEPPTLEKGLGKTFEGLAYLLICSIGFFYFFGAIFLWIWFIIPAMSCIGEGIGKIIESQKKRDALAPRAPFPPGDITLPETTQRAELPTRSTSEITMPPASITEETTRHLDAAGSVKP
jgi:zinc-ribbon domain